MPRTAETVEQQLQYVAAHPGVVQRHAFRARLVLAAAAKSLRAVAAVHGTTRNTVRKWVRRVAAEGIEGLLDAPRSGRPVSYPDNAARDLVTLATSKRPGPYALWTHRALRDAMWNLNWGVTCSWITTTLNTLGLKVHRVRGWIHRRPAPDFKAKVMAVHDAVTTASDLRPKSVPHRCGPGGRGTAGRVPTDSVGACCFSPAPSTNVGLRTGVRASWCPVRPVWQLAAMSRWSSAWLQVDLPFSSLRRAATCRSSGFRAH